jgi:hypothetical protein
VNDLLGERKKDIINNNNPRVPKKTSQPRTGLPAEKKIKSTILMTANSRADRAMVL